MTHEQSWMGRFRAHLFYELPREACGVLIQREDGLHYRPCVNMAEDSEHFRMDPYSYAQAEDAGEIVMILHSHPSTPAQPSMADRVGCEKSGIPWGIMDKKGNFITIQPSGYRAPLRGRPYTYGLLDCFALVRDYYAENLNIELPDEPRCGHWWERGEDKFMERYGDYGFRLVDSLKPHDLILMRVRSKVANHLAIYLGNDKMLHHPLNALSIEATFKGEWKRIVAGFLRHENY